MPEIRIVCVGKIKERYFQEGIRSFLNAVRRHCPIEIVECEDEATPDRASESQVRKILDLEGERILSRIRREDYVIALCIDGQQMSTEKWAKHFRKITGRVSGTGGSVVFIIGGSLGLSPQVLKRADENLSFSSLTFPHQMMRLILLEQIYSCIIS